MKKLISIFIAAGIISACSSSTPPYSQQQFATENYQENVMNAIEYADNFVDFDQNQLPKASLEADDLATLLKADLAFNQGNYAVAAEGYYLLSNKYNDPRIIYKAIVSYEHSSNSQQSLDRLSELVNRLVKVAPDSNVAHLFGIRIALEQNNLDLAKSDLKKVIKVDPTKTRSVLLFLSTIISNNVNPETEDSLVKFAKYVANKYSAYPEANLFALVAYSITEQEPELLATLTKTNREYPNWEVPVFWSAGILAKENNFPLLLTMMQHEIATLAKPSPTLVNLYIATLIRTGNLDAANQYIESAQKLTPTNGNLLVDSAIVNFKLAKTSRAIDALQTALSNNYSLDGTVNLALGSLYDSLSQSESAISNYHAAASTNPILEPAANVGMLRSYIRQGNYSAANSFIDTMSKAGKLNAHDSAILKLSIYTELGNYSEAYKIAAKDIKRYSNDKIFVYYYASLSAMTNRNEQAIIWYNKYIKLNPSDPVGYNDLGFLFADKTTNYVKAYALAEKAYKMSPNDPAVLDTIGWASFKLGEYAPAENYLSRAYKATQDRDTALHLRQVYLAEGKKDLADKVIVVSPEVQQMQLQKSLTEQSMLILMYYQFGLDFSKQ
jgi:tetratricopeptide (TPR) repeat protein